MARGSFRMSVCRGRGGGDGRRNNGRKDGGNYREGQRIAMKYGMEGRFISRAEHGDGLVLQMEQVQVAPGWQGRPL